MLSALQGESQASEERTYALFPSAVPKGRLYWLYAQHAADR